LRELDEESARQEALVAVEGAQIDRSVDGIDEEGASKGDAKQCQWPRVDGAKPERARVRRQQQSLPQQLPQHEQPPQEPVVVVGTLHLKVPAEL
jgi:hypothetical protein